MVMKAYVSLDALSTAVTVRLLMFAVCSLSALGGDLCVTTKDPTGQPLPGVTVMITRQKDVTASAPFDVSQTRTEANGQACFFKIRDGMYSVELALHGFLTSTYHPIRVDVLRPALFEMAMLFGQVIELDVSRIARISGILRLRNETVAEARICVYEKDSRLLVNCSRSDRFGQFGLLVEPGAYFIEVTRKDTVYLRKAITIPSGGTFRDLIPSELPELK